MFRKNTTMRGLAGRRSSFRNASYLLGAATLALLAACGAGRTPTATGPTSAVAVQPTPASSLPSNFPPAKNKDVLRLATTTSTQDSGLLGVIIPLFEKKENVRVDVVAVGTGQALEIGKRGDADVVLVHAPKQEADFVAAGEGIDRRNVMHNDFIVVGPQNDPAKAKDAAGASDAFKRIANAHAVFASRGDKSGTDTKEHDIWKTAGITPTKDLDWYRSLGQGMGETLLFANEKAAYTLTDRGTFLAQKSHLPNLAVIVGGASIDENKDKTLLNPYGVIVVNPTKHPGVNARVAEDFDQWIVSADTQKLIADYGKDKYGQSLFYPDAVK